MTDIFKGKIAIVTGGTSGIGYALSEELLRRGAIVWVIGSREQSVAVAKKSLASYPGARFAAVDVTVGDQVMGMIDTCVSECGRLDYLFNNAGIGMTHPSTKLTLDMWKKAIDLNLWGVIYGVHYALPVMLAQGSGHIVNTSSVAGIIAPPSQAVYCATKYAVTGMTEALRYEFLERASCSQRSARPMSRLRSSARPISPGRPSQPMKRHGLFSKVWRRRRTSSSSRSMQRRCTSASWLTRG